MTKTFLLIFLLISLTANAEVGGITMNMSSSSIDSRIGLITKLKNELFSMGIYCMQHFYKLNNGENWEHVVFQGHFEKIIREFKEENIGDIEELELRTYKDVSSMIKAIDERDKEGFGRLLRAYGEYLEDTLGSSVWTSMEVVQ